MKTRLLFLFLSVIGLLSAAASGQAPGRHADQARLWGTLEKLSEFGRPSGAGFEGGVTRVGFS